MSKTEFDQSLFEDSSTIHFGGDGEAEFDFLVGFDDAGDADTGAAASADTTDGGAEETGNAAPSGADAGTAPAAEGAPTTEQVQAQEQAQATPEKLTFRVKIDHKEQDVSVGHDELPGLYQRATNMDRANQRASEAQQEAAGYKDYIDRIANAARTLNFQGETSEAAIEAMLSGVMGSAKETKVQELVNGGTAKEVAEFIVDQQMKAPEPAKVAETKPVEPENAVPTPEQFSMDLQALMVRRPEVRSMEEFPEEVLQAYAQGENLTVAYLDYESRKTAAEMKALENQNKIFKQNQESASRAPVKGVSGSGGPDAKDDPWLQGFDDSYW